MKRMNAPLELKEVSSTGKISGYASIFGNVDLGGDIIVKDEPFKEFVKNADGRVVMLFSHDNGGFFGPSSAAGGMPIGTAEVEQNSKGLKFDGQLVMDDVFVRDRLYPQLKARTISGMSIGYDVLPGGAKVDEEKGVRELHALKLWEISPVLWGMNPKAGIDAVKSVETIKDFEAFLRDVGGFSKARAKAIASVGFKAAMERRDDADDAAEVANFVKFLESI